MFSRVKKPREHFLSDIHIIRIENIFIIIKHTEIKTPYTAFKMYSQHCFGNNLSTKSVINARFQTVRLLMFTKIILK